MKKLLIVKDETNMLTQMIFRSVVIVGDNTKYVKLNASQLIVCMVFNSPTLIEKLATEHEIAQ